MLKIFCSDDHSHALLESETVAYGIQLTHTLQLLIPFLLSTMTEMLSEAYYFKDGRTMNSEYLGKNDLFN